MRSSTLMFVGAFVVSAIASQATDADASIIGIVSVPGQTCNVTSPGYSYCPFISAQPTYSGHNVDNIYADYYVSAGTFWAAACEQSWTAGTLHCNAWATTTTTGYVDFHFSGFSSIASVSGSPYDYYYTEMYDATAYSFYGNGFN